MKLYSNNFSPNAKRARVCANELGITLNIIELDFSKGEHRKPEFLAKNPNGRVPTFEDDDGFVLWESTAIMTYLATKNPQKNLLPNDAKGRAETQRWLAWNSSHLEQAVYGVGVEKLVKPMFGAQPDQAKIDACTKDYERFMPVLDAHLKGKTWLLGDSFTIADISVGVVIEFGAPCGLDLAKYPNVKSWLGRLTERDAWRKASG
jgi:glutathione S-transferase